jgi:predicted nucleic acid-binding Zn ribbon protein
MSYNTEETWEDESNQWDGEDDYGDEDEEEPTILCLYCRAEIWEEALQCPECGEYLSLEDGRARQWQPRWIIITAALLLLLFALSLTGAP